MKQLEVSSDDEREFCANPECANRVDEGYCAECEAEAKRCAREAGIPLSVIEGRTKLRDHFSPEYIGMMKGGSDE